MQKRLIWSLAFGLLAALIALGVAGALLWQNTSGWKLLIPCSILAAFLLASLGAWLLLTLARPITVWKGVLVGLLVGLLAHPTTWYLAIIYLYLTGSESSLGESMLNPIQALWGSLVYSIYSLALVGWVTLPLSMVCSGGLAYYYPKRILMTESEKDG